MKKLLRTFVHTLRRSERGQAAFEFLLMLPMLVGILLFVVDIGVAMYEYVSVSNAVREGARYGAVNCPPSAGPSTGCNAGKVQSWAAGRTGGITIPNSEITVTWSGRNRGDSVAVAIDHPYHFLFFPGVTLHVKSCSAMRLEQQDLTTSLSGGGTC